MGRLGQRSRPRDGRKSPIVFAPAVPALAGDLAGDQGSDTSWGTRDQGCVALSQNAGSTHLPDSLEALECGDLPAAVATLAAHRVQIAALQASGSSLNGK